MHLQSKKIRDYFYGKDRVPTERYFSKDGIYLSRSGVKRLLDAINSATIIHVVGNYDLCVFSSPRHQNKRVSGNLNSYSNHRQGYQNRRPGSSPSNTERRHSNKRCYGCLMIGMYFQSTEMFRDSALLPVQ